MRLRWTSADSRTESAPPEACGCAASRVSMSPRFASPATSRRSWTASAAPPARGRWSLMLRPRSIACQLQMQLPRRRGRPCQAPHRGDRARQRLPTTQWKRDCVLWWLRRCKNVFHEHPSHRYLVQQVPIVLAAQIFPLTRSLRFTNLVFPSCPSSSCPWTSSSS
eukprot:COSAG01_NODE_1850_length_9063_cov_32.304552_10_plen_164_part_01